MIPIRGQFADGLSCPFLSHLECEKCGSYVSLKLPDPQFQLGTVGIFGCLDGKGWYDRKRYKSQEWDAILVFEPC